MQNRTGTRPAGVSLRHLFPDARFVGCGDIVASSVSSDSRRTGPGQLFVALRGTKLNGHRFLREAIQQGACGLLVEQADASLECPQCVVPDTRAAWGHLCQALAGHPGQALSLVGITGTNGKTTTSLLVREILTAAGLRTGLVGTLQYHDSVRGVPSGMTTPDPSVLAYWLHAMVRRDAHHAVMEVSSHALCQHRLEGLTLDVAAITNITRDHLDYHGTYEQYAQSKARIFDYLAAGGTAVVNLDDPATAVYRHRFRGNVLCYGVEVKADVSAALEESTVSGQRFRLRVAEEEAEVAIHLIGLHNVSNCLAAAAVAQHYGIRMEHIVAGLEGLTRVPGRLEPVDCGMPFPVYVDYAHTDDALRRVLATLRLLVPGRVICVFGAGGDRDRQKRPLMARAVETGADAAVVTSDNPRSEEPEKIIAEILEGFANREMVHVEPDRRRAIRWALENAAWGDAVLIAGKGHEAYQIIGKARIEFDDRAVVREEAMGQRTAASPRRNPKAGKPTLQVASAYRE